MTHWSNKQHSIAFEFQVVADLLLLKNRGLTLWLEVPNADDGTPTTEYDGSGSSDLYL